MFTRKSFAFAVLAFAAVALSAQAVNPDVSLTVNTGQQVTFTANADSKNSDGSFSPVTLQWQKDSVNLGAVISIVKAPTPPAPLATFVLPAVIVSNSGVYTAVIKNAGGPTATNKVTLIVNAPATAPTITTQPKSVAAFAGQSATFTVIATGTGPLSYQWQKDGVNWPFGDASAKTASFTNPDLDETDVGVYTCIVTGPGGTVTSAGATLALVKVLLPANASLTATAK